MYRKYLYGYMEEVNKIVINPEEIEILKYIFEAYTNQNKSCRNISDELNNKGIMYSENEIWTDRKVLYILKNNSYVEDRKYPRVIAEETFKNIMKKVNKNRENRAEAMKIIKIKEMMICEKCGGKINRRRTKNVNPIRWFCENDITHICKTITDEKVLKALDELIKTYKIQHITPKMEETHYIKSVRNEIDRLITQGNENTDTIKNMMENLVKDKYEQCISYNAQVKYREKLLEKMKESKEIDYKILKEIAGKVTIRLDGKLNIIERR